MNWDWFCSNLQKKNQIDKVGPKQALGCPVGSWVRSTDLEQQCHHNSTLLAANGEMYANCLKMFTGQTEKCYSRLVCITIREVHDDAEISYIYKTC